LDADYIPVPSLTERVVVGVTEVFNSERESYEKTLHEMMEKIMTAERVKTDKKFGRLRIAAKRT
jgi:hypothetical protein